METVEQLRLMDSKDIEIVYFSCIKVMKERKMYSSIKQKMKTHRRKANEASNKYITPEAKLNKYPLSRKTSNSCLIDMLNDDWKYLFKGNYDKSPDYYVYYHSYPNKINKIFKKDDVKIEFFGQPFYIGKGKDMRYLSFNRNRTHIDILNAIISNGFCKSDICHIYASGLTELEALELESKLITFWGCKNELRNSCHISSMNPQLVNTDYGMRPKWFNQYLKI